VLREIYLFSHALLVGKSSVLVMIIVKKRSSDVFGALVNVNVEFASAFQEFRTCSSVTVGVVME